MSCFLLHKKYVSSSPKKSWKKFIYTIPSKLFHLRKPKTTCRNSQPYHIHHHHHHHSNHNQREQPRKSSKSHFIENPSSRIQHQKVIEIDQHVPDEGCADDLERVYSNIVMAPKVNNFCNEPLRLGCIDAKAEEFIKKGKEILRLERQRSEEKYSEHVYSIVTSSKDNKDDDKWLQLDDVDAKAEEFIKKRKEMWWLERQRSEEEYWQMLLRGA